MFASLCPEGGEQGEKETEMGEGGRSMIGVYWHGGK